ncbi:MAG: hypothetical protein ACPGVD_07060 [Flavobacteriales bacterium]
MNQFLQKNIPYFPIIGMGIYLVLFTIAAILYPGGSDNLPLDQNGYSFFHNFLCDTNNEVTQSGLINPGQSIAVLAHLVLSFTMMSFFYILPEIFSKQNRNTKLIRLFGVLSMAIFVFMYQEDLHDLIVTLVGIFGSMAFVPIFIELVKYQNIAFKALTYLVFTMSILLFLGFETKIGIYYMPFFQKFAFIVDATLVVWAALIVIKKNKQS